MKNNIFFGFSVKYLWELKHIATMKHHLFSRWCLIELSLRDFFFSSMSDLFLLASWNYNYCQYLGSVSHFQNNQKIIFVMLGHTPLRTKKSKTTKSTFTSMDVSVCTLIEYNKMFSDKNAFYPTDLTLD